MTTPKQDRNGVPGPGATGGNVARPGPDATRDIAAAAAKAKAVAEARKMGDMTSGPATESGVRMWDQGLAISDVEGGGSA